MASPLVSPALVPSGLPSPLLLPHSPRLPGASPRNQTHNSSTSSPHTAAPAVPSGSVQPLLPSTSSISLLSLSLGAQAAGIEELTAGSGDGAVPPSASPSRASPDTSGFDQYYAQPLSRRRVSASLASPPDRYDRFGSVGTLNPMHQTRVGHYMASPRPPYLGAGSGGDPGSTAAAVAAAAAAAASSSSSSASAVPASPTLSPVSLGSSPSKMALSSSPLMSGRRRSSGRPMPINTTREPSSPALLAVSASDEPPMTPMVLGD